MERRSGRIEREKGGGGRLEGSKDEGKGRGEGWRERMWGRTEGKEEGRRIERKEEGEKDGGKYIGVEEDEGNGGWVQCSGIEDWRAKIGDRKGR